MKPKKIELLAYDDMGYVDFDAEFDTVKEARIFAGSALLYPAWWDRRAERADAHKRIYRIELRLDGVCVRDWFPRFYPSLQEQLGVSTRVFNILLHMELLCEETIPGMRAPDTIDKVRMLLQTDAGHERLQARYKVGPVNYAAICRLAGVPPREWCAAKYANS